MCIWAINVLSDQVMSLSNFSLFNECTVMLVCVNPVNRGRAFVNYAFTVIITFNFLIISHSREKALTGSVESA